MLTGSRVRIRGSILVMFLGISVLASCSSSEPPAPTPTALFASDEEAFAAAEATLVRWIEASNEVDLRSPESFEGALRWLTGGALSDGKKELSFLHAEGLTKLGDQIVDSFEGESLYDSRVTVTYCLDISGVEVWDSEGQSVVPPDRVDRMLIRATLVPSNMTTTGLAIESTPAAEDSEC